MVKSKVKMKLQGHEKFVLREGWINKALKILSTDPGAFSKKDATDIFGIGNNMVKSLKYWMKAFKLIENKGSNLSELGLLLAKEDPYMEKQFTWWLLHSNIAKNLEEATTWYMYFNHCDAEDLTKEQIEKILFREVSKYASGKTFSEKSLNNDVDVLLNMYGKCKDDSDPENKNISPFVNLKLLKNIDGKYIKTHPDFRSFPKEIVLYEIALRLENQESVSIESLIYDDCGLVKIYNLTSVMANEILDRLDADGYIKVDRTAGLDMIYPVINQTSKEIVEKYYKS